MGGTNKTHQQWGTNATQEKEGTKGTNKTKEHGGDEQNARTKILVVTDGHTEFHIEVVPTCKKISNKLGLSCAKLSKAKATY